MMHTVHGWRAQQFFRHRFTLDAAVAGALGRFYFKWIQQNRYFMVIVVSDRC